MYYTVYKITNKISGKFYIGTHKTKNLDDRYYGSGKYLKRSIEKHGIENFEKEILFVFDNSKDMFAKEAEIVNEDFLAEENTYNLKIGGFGGFDHINVNPEKYLTEKRLQSLMSIDEANSIRKAQFDSDPVFRERLRETSRKNLEKARSACPGGSFKGKKHSDMTKSVMSVKAKERLQDPTNNSQYGTRWIHSLEERKSRKINKDAPLPDGWKEGRKIKFTTSC